MAEWASATLSAHRVRNRRHAAAGTVEMQFLETVVSLRGTLREIRAVRAVELCGRRVELDHDAMLANHGSHADPLVPAVIDGGEMVQIFLADLEPGIVREGPVLELAQGRTRHCPEVWEGDRAPAETIASSLARHGTGRWSIAAASSQPFEVLVQRFADGRAQETRTVLPAGSHEISVGPCFGEVHGVALSSLAIAGGLEHKHMILGKFGLASGRHLLSGGALLPPRAMEPFAYRSLVSDVRSPACIAATLAHAGAFDEIELWCAPDLASACSEAGRGRSGGWRVRTHAPPGDDASCDVTTLAPGDTPPMNGRPFSYMLFRSARDEDFGDRLAAAAACARSRPEAPLIDRAWLSCKESHDVGRGYGIGYSLPGPGRGERRDAMDEIRRRRLPDSPCNGCGTAARCDATMPHPREGFPAPGESCGIMAHLL